MIISRLEDASRTWHIGNRVIVAREGNMVVVRSHIGGGLKISAFRKSAVELVELVVLQEVKVAPILEVVSDWGVGDGCDAG